MTVNFLLRATRIIHSDDYDDDELVMVYDYIRRLDNETLIVYLNTCTVISYDNDLEFFIEIIDGLISILEKREEYEKCDKLFKRKQQSLEIIKLKKI